MKIEFMYKYFMMTPVSHLPVVDENGKLVGLLSRQKLKTEMSDLSFSDREFDEIPRDFLEFELSENIVNYFTRHGQIPVLALSADNADFWDKPRFLAEFSRLQDSAEKPEKKEEVSVPDPKDSHIRWYMELVLQNFPDPLLATDLDGNSIFYNENFIQKILSQKQFRGSISFAERYLRDLNRELFARYLKAHDLELNDDRVIKSWLKNIEVYLRVITLTSESGKVVGFLYHFSEREAVLGQTGRTFPDVEEAYGNHLPLDLIKDEVEKSYIQYTIEDSAGNISHTAEKLNLPRSTLQNRMKQLGIRFETEEPVPRKREKTEEKAPPVKKKAVKKGTKKAVKKVSKKTSPRPKKNSPKKSDVKSAKKRKNISK